MGNLLIKVLAMALGLLASTTLWADSGDPETDEQAALELVARLAAVESFSARFEQLVLDQNDTRIQQAEGRILVSRPRMFRWHAETPFEQLVISDGNRLWIHDVDLEQVIERSMGDEIADTPALLFSGDPDRVAESFAITRIGNGGEWATWRLVPRDEGEPLFSVLEVTFADKQPQSMRLEDALGQKTVIDFLQVDMNVAIDEKDFRFVPPDGVDLISEE